MKTLVLVKRTATLEPAVLPKRGMKLTRETGAREFRPFRWGLVPSWAKDPTVGNWMINARSETVATKPAFRTALRKRRCLILADGFYEWKREGERKQPYYIKLREGQPFAFAGLWDRWHLPDGQPLESCTILTTTPNEVLQPLHDRMPVILPSSGYGLWLDPTARDVEPLQALLTPYLAAEMITYPVSTRVNNPAYDSPECIAAGVTRIPYSPPVGYTIGCTAGVLPLTRRRVYITRRGGSHGCLLHRRRGCEECGSV